MQSLIQQVAQSVQVITRHPSFQAWLKNANPGPGDLIVLNNSFIHRSGIRTNKNQKYLALQVGDDGRLALVPHVVDGFAINSDFRHVSKKTSNYPDISRLPDALEEELDTIGTLVFILIGDVDDSVVTSCNVAHRRFSELILDPSYPKQVEAVDDKIVVRDTYDEEQIWSALCKCLEDDEELRADEGLRKALGEALDRVESQAYAKLVLPDDRPDPQRFIINAVVSVLEEQRNAYRSAFERCKGDPEADHAAFNEILRIAYNFASDAVTLIRLITNIADLKPLVMWGTIGEHFILSESLRQLPWLRSRNKPSLDNYVATIGDARNSAFHHLFPFNKTLEVSLPDSALRQVSLRIFSEHRKKKENQLRYEDKELVDVLTEFTRAGERRVPARFWRENIDVMNSAIDLFAKTGAVLNMIFQEVRKRELIHSEQRPAVG